MNDMSAVIVPKSDQMSADDLISGPRAIRINDVSIRPGTEQPVTIRFDGDDGRPYKPCKSMCRVMVAMWGADTSVYPGRYLVIYRDPAVKWGGMEVGGIRISEAWPLDRPLVMALTQTKGSKKMFTVRSMKKPPEPEQKAEPPKPASAPAGLAILTADHTLRRVSPGVWLSKIKEVLAPGKIKDSEALRGWRAAMGPHLGAVAEADSMLAAEAEQLIEARLEELAEAEGA